MTPGAVLSVQEGEIQNLVRGDRPVGRVGSAGKIASGQKQHGDKETREKPGRSAGAPRGNDLAPVVRVIWHQTTHGIHSFSNSLSRPAPLPAGGTGIFSERSTTKAATAPNTNCETMNHGQSTRACSTGFATPIRP